MTGTADVESLVVDLHRLGVRLWEEDGRLRYRAPRGLLTPERLDALRAHKEEVLAQLREQEPVSLTSDPAARHDPFPLTDVQAAYLLGRGQAFDHGGVACHVYLEIDHPDLDPERAISAWRRLVERHDMLRVVIEPDGYQRVLPTVPPLDVRVLDLREADPRDVDGALAATRDEMDHTVHDTATWPVFGVRLTRTPSHGVLHLSIDFLVADWTSIWMLLGEFEALHTDPTTALPPIEVTFRDYVLAERRLRDSPRHRRDREYWWDRLDDLPGAPELPTLGQVAPPRFVRRGLRLERPVWEALKGRTHEAGLTPSAAVLTAYAAVIQRWCGTPRFALNLTVLNRLPLHPAIRGVVGDFTSVNVLAVEWASAATFAERVALIGARLFDDLDHSLCTGVEVLRELARRRGREAAMLPVVFTSAIGLGDSAEGLQPSRRPNGHGVSQTPQVFLDCQAMDDADGLTVNWDAREGVFPDGLVDDLFAAFETLLRGLATTDALWRRDDVVDLPAWQHEERRVVNDTAAPLPTGLLHGEVLAQAARTPDRSALVGPAGTVTYAQLVGRAGVVARALLDGGCAPGDRVAIVMDKGVEQVVAVLAVLAAGAVFVPVDTVQPRVRREAMLADAGVRQVLTQTWLAATTTWPSAVAVRAVETPDAATTPTPEALPATATEPDDPAYVIFTSGSTGRPKGVVMTHRAAANTVVDVNRRFGVTADDRVLGVSNLGFDLSVYDLFGPLSVGGALVLPDAGRPADPSHWGELLDRHAVTVWNSVPALMQMLTSYLRSDPSVVPHALRLVLLSGDWIPLTLPDEVLRCAPQALVVGLGGATEAAIWSVHHEIHRRDPGWPSVPYGTPLANQGLRVLDPAGRDCPVWVPGDLVITGVGLARGYLGDPTTTASRFVGHPSNGQRLYRTGDLARYRPGGALEFLGREDNQVKVRGHRIELGEIEATLAEHPAVAAACVVLDRTTDGRGLLGVVETARRAPVVDDGRAPRTATLVAEATADLLLDVDGDLVAASVARLDAAVLTAMALALRDLGLFASTSVDHDVADLTAAVEPRHRWLLRRWLAVLVDAGHLAALDGGRRLVRVRDVDDEAVASAWRAAEDAAVGLGSVAFLRYLRSNTEVLPALLRGEQDPVALLFPGGHAATADALYRENLMVRYLNRGVAAILREIADEADGAAPLRVLEVGAGTGATTESALDGLAGHAVDYLFTDVSAFFLPDARVRFGAHPAVRFGLLDVDREPRAQGFTPNAFDVVLAAGVLENAQDPEAALERLRELTAPGGRLVITEPTREHPWILASQAFMMTPPQDAARAEGSSYLSRDDWLRLLEGAGAVETVCLPDDGHPLAAQGLHLFAARWKADRVAVRPEELRGFLGERLPDPMIPAQLQVVDALPLSANGKLDRDTVRGWEMVPTGPDTASVADAPADELEAELAAVWSQALATGPIGRTESLLERGADSLIMARTAGRLREELPAAAAVPFDTLLRHMLNVPTVAGLADLLRARAADGADPRPGAAVSNAALVRFGENGAGPLRAMFHAGMGTMDCFRPLAARLVGQALGPVIGIAIDDPQTYCALDPAEAVERLADDYAERLLAEGHERFQLVGYCVGGLYATEVARRLLERGAEVEDLVLASSHPVLVDVQEDLMIEALFIPNLGIGLPDLGCGPVDPDSAGRAFAHAIELHGGAVPLGSLGEVGGDPGLDEAAAFFRRLGARSQEERFALYAETSSRVTGGGTPAEMVSGMFRVLRQSFLSTRFRPEPYAGDVRFLMPQATSGFAPGLNDDTLDFWRQVCVGGLDVIDVDGDHFSCMNEPRVAELAAHIAAPVRPHRS